MEIIVKATAHKDKYTMSKMYINGNYVCDVIEDKVRDLSKEKKVYGETAIPAGKYEITMNAKSPKYSNYARYSWAKKYDGFIPRLLDVPNFEGVLIHVGNDEGDSSGCLIVGQNKVVGKVVNSVATFTRIMDEYFVPAKNKKEKIYITIIR